MVEVLISETGRIVRMEIMRSIPRLDAAAVKCLLEWEFEPARKDGRPVATMAMAPVTFRIF